MVSRHWFRLGDLLDELARNRQTLEVDAALRHRIFEILYALIQYRQFAAGQVATLSGEVPSFVSLPPASPGSTLVVTEDFMMRRDFVERFIKAYNALPNAAPLQRQWFAEFNQEASGSSCGTLAADVCERASIASKHATTQELPAEREQQRIDQETHEPRATPATQSVEAAIDQTDQVKRLAEWIFSMRGQLRAYRKLLAVARGERSLGGFRVKDFLAAFQLVYETKPHSPPATGWPLRSLYKERDEAESLST